MILVIDVGNTNMVLGVFEGQKLVHHWRLATNRAQTADEYGMKVLALFRHVGISETQLEGIAISSVVPPVMMAITRFCRDYLGHSPLVVQSSTIQAYLELAIDHPAELGADRIVNAVAAIAKYGSPVMIVDFGTATTVCYVDESGRYQGGAIAPGIGISTEALYQKAAKLPRIELQAPSQPVGRNTIQAMQAGILFGFAGQVDGIVERMAAGLAHKPTVVATGGLAELISGESKTIDVLDPFLTLEGLRLIFENENK